MEEDIEIIKCAEEYACELKPKSKREYKNLVNAYIAGADEMRKRRDRQISELTEQLDASYNKACREFCYNCTHYENCDGHCYRYKHFNEAIKGK